MASSFWCAQALEAPSSAECCFSHQFCELGPRVTNFRQHCRDLLAESADMARVAGDRSGSRIEGTVEAFTALQRGLDVERRLKGTGRIDCALAHADGMSGEVHGIPGQGMPPAPALELVPGRREDLGADMVA
jgi:hypothetical protein